MTIVVICWILICSSFPVGNTFPKTKATSDFSLTLPPTVGDVFCLKEERVVVPKRKTANGRTFKKATFYWVFSMKAAWVPYA